MKETTQEQHLADYFDLITPLIVDLITRKRNTYSSKPTMFSKEIIDEKQLETSFYVRQLQMKEGKIAQILIGNWVGWETLKKGHLTGLDCRKLNNSAIMELKNKYNTCNSCSQKTLLDKLAKYKKENPTIECIWGIINPRNNNKLTTIIRHDKVEIKKLQGEDLFSYVFTLNGKNYSDDIIRYVKQLLKGLINGNPA